jgi:putative permease
MINVFRHWAQTYFSDEEAIYLLLVLLGGLLVVVFFGKMLAPVFTAMVLAYLMQGLVNKLRRLGVSQGWSVWLVFLLFLGGLLATLFVLLPVVWKQTVALVQEQTPLLLKNGEQWLRQLPERYPQVITTEQVASFVELARTEVAEAGQAVLSVSLSSIPGLFHVLLFLVLVPVLVFFFLKDRQTLGSWMAGFLPERRDLLASVWREMDGQIANYVRGKAVEVMLVGVASYLAFVWLDLNYALLLGVLVGLSVIVPYVGATVVTFPVAAVAWIQFGVSTDFALVMLIYAVIQFVDGNILVPLLFSEVVNLHPVAIITAVLFFGGLWGLWGVFFAIPLATLIKAVMHAWPRNRQPDVPEAES